jgi:hypothetical protein
VGALKAEENLAAAPGEAPPFVDPAKGDYRLRPGVESRLVHAGQPLERIKLPAAPGEPGPPPLAKPSQYKAPLQAEPRAANGRPTIGAQE